MSWQYKGLLEDSSWIRRHNDDDVDQEPNYARSGLSHISSETTTERIVVEEPILSTTSHKSYVQSMSERFGGSQDELSNTYTYTRRSPVSKTSTKTETFSERVRSSSKGAQYTSYSPTKTTKVTETTVTSNKDAEDRLYDKLIPFSIKNSPPTADSKSTVTTTETVTVTDPKVEDFLLDKLNARNDVVDSKIVSSTETVIKKSSGDEDAIKTTTRTSSSAEDGLYGSLVPKFTTSDYSSLDRESPTVTSSTRTISYSSITDDISTTTTTRTYSSSDDYSSERKSYSFSRPNSSYEYSSITSPTTYTSYRSSRSDDILTDPNYSKSSVKNVYTSSERTLLDKDLCTICRKPFTGDAKMVLEDIKINCHASCFKCDVCNSTLGNLKAGDSLWVYKRMVHCDNCFEVTRDKWRR